MRGTRKGRKHAERGGKNKIKDKSEQKKWEILAAHYINSLIHYILPYFATWVRLCSDELE
jgi:hypothetical protein